MLYVMVSKQMKSLWKTNF